MMPCLKKWKDFFMSQKNNKEEEYLQDEKTDDLSECCSAPIMDSRCSACRESVFIHEK